MAIEVEQKFLLTPEEEDRVLDGADFIKQQSIQDLYFENNKLALTTTDRWLRCRDGHWQLKLPHNWPRTSTVRQYTELESEAEIREALKIAPEKDLLSDLNKAGYEQFAVIRTLRQKYKKGKFGIDLDSANISPEANETDMYQVAEIELMVETESMRETAVQEILKFAQQHSIIARHIRGKLVEFIRRYRPEHFQVLVKAGVVEAN